MKRLLIVLCMMLFLGISAAQAQAMTVTGDITTAYCSYLEYTYTITDYPVNIDYVNVRFYTDDGSQIYTSVINSGVHTSEIFSGSILLPTYGVNLPANTNIQMKVFVNDQDPNATPDFVSDFVPCIAPSVDIAVPVEASAPPGVSLLPGYNPNVVGYTMSIYPLGGDDEGFQIIGNLGQYLVVTGEEIANLPENPDTNLLVAGVEGGYSLYYLTTGEFQINTAPSIEGKVFSIIFNLETGEFYTREFNIYDVLEGTS